MDRFARINSAAHEGDFGLNSRVHPSLDQIRAGNYKKGRTRLYGLNIAIETPQGQRRTGKANGEPWSVICQAHYGYLVGTKAADGDPIDVYIGPWPEARMVYVINQNDAKGRFDEVKVMMAFPDAQSAKSAYLNSYERGWTGFGSMVACTVEQFKWWLKNGNTTVALSSAALPYDRTNENDTMTVVWDSAANPVGTDIASIIYRLRCDDSEGAMLDAINEDFIIAASDGEMMLDALVVPFAKVERKMSQMQKVMEMSANGVTVTGMQITAPFKQRGTTNVAAIFELSDGQTVSIFMHNPDTNPNKLAPNDELISWKWMLNKKDITILVAPEKGEDLNVREVARRIMRLAGANSAKFQAANGKRAERMAAIQGMKDQVAEKEAISAQLDTQIADLTTKVEAKRASPKPAPAKKTPDDVSSRDGQMNLATRGARIAALLAMNEQIKAIDPTEAWSAENINNASNSELDRLQDEISQMLVNVSRLKQIADALLEKGWVNKVKRKDNGILNKNAYQVVLSSNTGTYRINRDSGDEWVSDGVDTPFSQDPKADAERIDAIAGATPAPSVQADNMDEARAMIASAAFKSLTGDFIQSLATIRDIDQGGSRGFDRNLFVTSIVGKINRLAPKNPLMAALALAWLSTTQEPWKKPAVTYRNGVWNAVQGWEKYKVLFAPASTKTEPAPAGEKKASAEDIGYALQDALADFLETHDEFGMEYDNVVQNKSLSSKGTASGFLIIQDVSDATDATVTEIEMVATRSLTGKVIPSYGKNRVAGAEVNVVGNDPEELRRALADAALKIMETPAGAKTEPAPAAGTSSGIEAAVADIKTRFTTFDDTNSPAGWLVMNAPRPLLGTKTVENGTFLSGRFYAAISPTDDMASRWIAENKKLDAVMVLVANMDEQMMMALNKYPKYKGSYLEIMANDKDASAIKSLLPKIQNAPYSEAVAMLSAARAELAGRTLAEVASSAYQSEPAPAVAKTEPAPADTTAEDSSFIKTVIDGSADLYDKAVTDRLAALANQYKDGPMADLLKQAKTAAKKFFIAEFQKKTGG